MMVFRLVVFVAASAAACADASRHAAEPGGPVPEQAAVYELALPGDGVPVADRVYHVSETAEGVVLSFPSGRAAAGDTAFAYRLVERSETTHPVTTHPARIRIEGPSGLPGVACPQLGQGTHEAAVALDLQVRADGTVAWDSSAATYGPHVLSLSRHPAGEGVGTSGEALAVLSSANAPERVRGLPLGGFRLVGPFYHEVFRLPDMERVGAPFEIDFPGGGSPSEPCWTASGQHVVYVAPYASAAAVAPGVAAR